MSVLVAPQVMSVNVLLNKFKKVVVEKNFLLPNGITTQYIVWGGTKVPSIIFPVVLLESGIHVLALHQFRYGANEFVIEIPGGNPKGDEAFEEVTRLELLEETGYQADKIVRLDRGAPIWFEPSACFTVFIPVLALGCKKVADPQPDQEEVLEVLVIPLPEWKEMIADGRIRDAKTIAVTYLALPFLENKKSF